jgi:DNA mismatch repair protein MutL
MPSKIRVLDEQTINKIAAGEVIENPASVVKELTENALDAGATEITIETKGGGRQLVRITDNGCGMNPDDALLCLERHATSKLKEIDELHSIGTMGFRGEAVPSIASISKFTLFTRVPTEETGTLIRIEGGKILSCSPVECAPGTTIEVKDLFFNVPVRKKFQRSPTHDATEIQKIVIQLALGNPSIQFRLISNQEIIISTASCQHDSFSEALGERIRQLLGTEFYAQLTPLSGTKGDYHLEGFVGNPSAARHNRSGQHLFINRRGVVVPLVSFAARDGYGTMLPSAKHPLYVFHLTMPMDLLDVNVHPQKREVRLRQERLLKELIFFSVEEALQKKQSFTRPFPSQNHDFPPLSEFPEVTLPWVSAQRPSQPPTERPYALPKLSTPLPTPKMAPAIVQEPHLFDPLPPQEPKKQPSLEVIGTVQKYILATSHETSPELTVIDQRAAHARIIFEKLLTSTPEHQEMQLLLVPYIIELSVSDASTLRSQLESLQNAGIQIKEFGHTSFAIDAIPQIFGSVDLHKLIDEILKNSYEENDPTIVKREHQKKLAQAASRAAIASGKHLSRFEAQQLVDQLVQCRHPLQCPYGKTTMVKLSSHDIGKLFQSSG